MIRNRSFAHTILIISLSLCITASSPAQLPHLPVRQIFRSPYPAQYLESIWQDEGQFRVALGYSNACTIAGSDSFVWRSGQLNGLRVNFDRIALPDENEVVAIAVRYLNSTALNIYSIEGGEPPETIDAVIDSNYWERNIYHEVRNSVVAVESVEGDDSGLLFYATNKSLQTTGQGVNRTWRLSGELVWRDLGGGVGERFPTGGVSALKCLKIAGEEAPRVYYGVTYETGSYSPDSGGFANMGCELVRFDPESEAEWAFHTIAGERNDEGVAPARVSVQWIDALEHVELGPLVVALYASDEAASLAILDGGDLELIATSDLPSPEEAGLVAGLAIVSGRSPSPTDLMIVYRSGLVLTVQISGETLEIDEWTLGGAVTSASAGNFDEDDDLELAATMERRLNVFDLLPLSVPAPSSHVPIPLSLYAFPSPFNSSTTVRFNLPHEAQASLGVYDPAGRRIADLLNGVQTAGDHKTVWDAGQIPAGLYFIKATVNGEVRTQKALLVK